MQHAPHSGTVDVLNADSVSAYVAAMHAAVDALGASLAAAEQPFDGTTADVIADRVEAVDLDEPLGSTEAALAELGDVWTGSAVWFHHPRYVAHLNCPVLIPALAADALASAVNTSMDTWDQSTAATQIERRMVRWTAERIGFGACADGVFTSGGTASNQQAMLLAREDALARAGLPAGPEGIAKLRILATDQGHFSVANSAKLLGLAPGSVVRVATDERHRMDVAALRAEIAALRAEGLVPMAVVATAGTTDLGAIDPLLPMAELCAREDVWFHVDAAYGGGLLASSRHRYLLDGIERADSVTVDFHKTWFLPVAASVVVVRHGHTLGHITHHAEYLNPRREDPRRAAMPNQVDKSLQTTRRFDAVKLWTALRATGVEAIGAMVDQMLRLADETADLLEADPAFRLCQRPTLSTVVFRIEPEGRSPEEIDALCDEIVTRLLIDGTSLVARTRIDGRTWLKFTLLNPTATMRDLAAVLAEISECARAIEAERVDAREAVAL